MILADKIIKLRKQFGWSQEELAEKMNVSRQSVSKWESANSIPDLNKILLLAEIFGVSTDYLVKDEIEEVESISEDKEPGVLKITLEEANEYIETKVRASKVITIGVLMCVFATIPLMVLLGLSSMPEPYFSSNTAAGVGLVILLVTVAGAISFFIRGTQYDAEALRLDDYDSFELVYGVKSIFKEELKKFKPTYYFRMSISVSLFVMSVVPLIVVSIFGGSGMLVLLMVAVLLFMIGSGIGYLVPVSAKFTAYSALTKEGDYAPKRRKETKKTEKFGAVYWPLVTAVYIGWSLWTMAWGITWIVWPVAGIAFAGLLGLIALFDKE